MSHYVEEAQRIAREAGEKAAKEVADRANVALGWLVQNAPAAAQCVLESIVLRQPMPPPEAQRGYAQGDWARADAETQALAINDMLAKARDAALEEVRSMCTEETTTCLCVPTDEPCGSCKDHTRLSARIRAMKGRK